MCLPPNSYVGTLPSNVRVEGTLSLMVFGDGAFGRLVSHESRALRNGISVLIIETPESCFLSVRRQQKLAVCEPGSRASPDALMLDIAASRTEK